MAGSGAEVRAAFNERGLEPHQWSNIGDYRYDWHQHPYHKVLYCAEGSITFHTDSGDIDLVMGDWLELPPGARHAATVGPAGVTCWEAAGPIQ